MTTAATATGRAAGAAENERALHPLLSDLPGMAYRRHNDPACTLEFVSEGCLALTGYRAEELAGNRVIAYGDLIHPADRQQVRDLVQAAIAARQPFDLHYRIRTAAGAEKWVMEHGCGVFAAAGELQALTGFIFAGGAAQATEVALRQQERAMQGLLNAITDSVFLMELDGTVVYANATVAERLHTTPGQMVGRNIYEFVDAELAARRRQRVEESQRTRQPIFFVDQRGDRWIENSLYPICDEHGDVIQVAIYGRDITARRRAEEAFRQREQEYRALVENSPDVITRFDRELRHLYVSPSVERATGMPPASFVGKTNRELGQPEEQVRFWEEKLRQVFATGRSLEIEFDYPTPAGREYFESTLIPEFDADNTVATVLTVARNVTRRKQVELELRASEQSLRRIIETAQEGIWVIDAEALTTYANPAMAAMLGVTVEEMIGQHLFSFMDEAARQDAIRNLERRRQGIVEQHDFRFRRRDGSNLWALLSTNPILDDAGRYQGALAMLADISDRRAAEAALRASEAQFRGVVAAMTEGVVMHAASGAIILANPSAERILGLSYDQLIGRTPYDPAWHTVHEDGSPFPGETHPASVALRTGEAQANVIMGVHQPDGKLTWISINVQPLQETAAAAPYAVVTTFHDITERRQAEARLLAAMNDLERSNRDLEQFAYVVSHDLQEPLRMVAAFVQLLAQNYQGRLDADADAYIGYAVDGAKRMQQLTADLLAYSRVSTRSKEFAPVDCTAVVQNVLKSLQLTVEETGAVVECGPLPAVLGDAAQIYQVFLNLAANALKYRSSAPPHIVIGCSPTPEVGPQGRLGCFWVRDNGIGIEPEYFERIFVIFQRLHTRAEYPGTGIGLAICKKIVERHGGRIWVESQPGAGATFYFTLPLVD